MTLVSSIGIAQQALTVSQACITTVSNNIANVDTEGYSKLRVNQSTVINYSNKSGDSPLLVANSYSGVQIDNITRYTDSAMKSYYWQENSSNSYYTQYSSTATSIQDLVNELNDTGLSSALSKFYTAANALSNNAKDITVRQNYVSAAENVCSVFNQMSKKISDLQTNLVGDTLSMSSSQISSNIDDANSLIDQLAKVNSDIIKTNTETGSSSALLDQRDLLVGKLSALIPVRTEENANGTISVSLGDRRLVDQGDAQSHLKAANSLDASGNLVTTVSLVDANDSTIVKAANVNSDISGGTIGAILDACGTDTTKLNVSGVISKLNTMASNFASVMNTIQNGDPNGDGTTAYCMDSSTTLDKVNTPPNLFVNSNNPTATETVGITAANIAVKSTVVNNPYLVAAARGQAASVSTTDVGNNSNITLVMSSRSKNYAGYGNTTLEGYLSGMVSSVGAQTSSIETAATNQALVLKEVSTKLSSKTGVNMDEELTDLIKYQRAYQAAARVFSTCNDLLDTLMNMGK